MAKYLELEGKIKVDLTSLFNNILKPKIKENKEEDKKKDVNKDE